MTPKEYLKNCTDQELFEIITNVNTEVDNRLVNLLKGHNCTTVYIPGSEDLRTKVNDVYGIHGLKGDKDEWVNVSEIGYGTVLDSDDHPVDFIYIVTYKGEIYAGDELCEDTIWDLYKSVKDKFEKP